MSNRFIWCDSGTRSATQSLGTIGRKPPEIAAQAVARTHPLVELPTMIVVHWSLDGSSVYLSPGLMMVAARFARLSSVAADRVAARSRAVIARCIVPFAVLLHECRVDSAAVLFRNRFLVTATSARLYAASL